MDDFHVFVSRSSAWIRVGLSPMGGALPELHSTAPGNRKWRCDHDQSPRLGLWRRLRVDCDDDRLVLGVGSSVLAMTARRLPSWRPSELTVEALLSTAPSQPEALDRLAGRGGRGGQSTVGRAENADDEAHRLQAWEQSMTLGALVSLLHGRAHGEKASFHALVGLGSCRGFAIRAVDARFAREVRGDLRARNGGLIA